MKIKKILLVKEKSGVMDDVTDLLSFALILSMVGFIAAVVLRTDVNDKTDQTMERIASFHGQQEILDLVSYPVLLDGKEVVMKDLILFAANANDGDLFREKIQTYFDERKTAGGVAVYDSISYGTKEEPDPLLFYDFVFLNGKMLPRGIEKGALYLNNVNGEGNKKLLVVKLFS